MPKYAIETDIAGPCPVCRSVRNIKKHYHGFYIECQRCGKKGAKADKLKEAIRLWNKADETTK